MNQIMEANGQEIHAIEFIAGLHARLKGDEKALEARLKAIPNGWRDYRLVSSRTEHLLDEIYKTLPTKTLIHMQRLCECGQIIIRPKPLIKMPDDVQIVCSDDLKTLINHAIENTCTICVKDHKGQKKCPLRKALMNIAPTGDIHKDGHCSYMDVVAGNELGKYI